MMHFKTFFIVLICWANLGLGLIGRNSKTSLSPKQKRRPTSLHATKFGDRVLQPLKKAGTVAVTIYSILGGPKNSKARAQQAPPQQEKVTNAPSAPTAPAPADQNTQPGKAGASLGPQRQKTSVYDYFGNSKGEGIGEDGSSSTGSIAGGGGAVIKRRDRGSSSSSFVRDAVRTVGPSVVRIDCERDIPQMVTMFAPDNFREGDTMKVSGSGFVVTQDGFILTNAHVVEGAKKTTISLSNGRSFKAVVVALDELTDLAVLKADVSPADSKYLTIAPLGDSSKLQSGDWVIAVGCPVGLDFTVTLGIVSSPKRSAVEVGATHLKGSYIQTDAALNSGNSGGPLVNDVGEVVGINTMVRTNTEAIGFAIPINRARKIYEVLKQGKKPTHAYFGIEVMTITPDFANIHNDDPNAQRLAQIHGALVTRVLPGSPAASSGLRKNDIIIGVNGNAISNSHDADTFLDMCKPGTPAKLKIARGETGGEVHIFANPENLLVSLIAN